jgi:PHD/YefM family antitoxin component YafN of YafNO toxin-antitoxin module
MIITTISSRKFNQSASEAKKISKSGPVFITDRGRPAHVLLTYENYQRLIGTKSSVVELLALPGAEDIELSIPTMNDFPIAADFS